MRSMLFRVTSSAVAPVMLVLSVVLLLRGHNEPGGGFVGGLMAAAAFALYALSDSAHEARRRMRFPPMAYIGAGLFAGAISGIPGLFFGTAYLDSFWTSIPVPGFDDPVKVGTPLLFDVGVYLLVIGGTSLMVLSLEEAWHGTAAGD